jgi:hypothetical protein
VLPPWRGEGLPSIATVEVPVASTYLPVDQAESPSRIGWSTCQASQQQDS